MTDLIATSGREALPLAERIQLLENQLLFAPFNGITTDTPAATQAIHDLKVTVGAIRSVIEMYRAARARGVPDDVLTPGAATMVAPYECWVLAWKRGGHLEWQRVRKEQFKRKVIL